MNTQNKNTHQALVPLLRAAFFVASLTGALTTFANTYPNGTYRYAAPPLAALPNPPPSATYTPATMDDVGLQAAINAAASAGGGTVQLASGIYVINKTVVPKSHVFINGAGMGVTIVQRGPNFVYPTGLTNPAPWTGLIYYDSALNGPGGVQDVRISNFTIDGNLTAAQRASAPPLFYGFGLISDDVLGNHNYRLQHSAIEIKNCGMGTENKGISEVTLDGGGNYHDNGAGGTLLWHNIYFRRAGDITLNNITCTNSGASGFKFAGGTSAFTNDSKNLTITGCTIQNNGYCDLYLTGVTGIRIYSNTLNTAGTLNQNTNGAGVYMNSETDINGTVIPCDTFDVVNNIIQNTAYYVGFKVGGSQNGNISGNWCTGNATNYSITGTNILCDNNTTSGTSVPAAPSGLSATAGNAQVTLSWAASAGAASYNVKSATVSGGPYTTIATGVTTTSYTNTGLTNGTTYYYVVSAVNAVGESVNSTQVSATPVAGSLPPAPTGLTVTDNNNQAVLSWSALTGATSYKVKRATVSGGPYTVIATPIGTTYTDTTVVTGTYYYVVSAVNAVGESPNSSQVSYTPGG